MMFSLDENKSTAAKICIGDFMFIDHVFNVKLIRFDRMENT